MAATTTSRTISMWRPRSLARTRLRITCFSAMWKMLNCEGLARASIPSWQCRRKYTKVGTSSGSRRWARNRSSELAMPARLSCAPIPRKSARPRSAHVRRRRRSELRRGRRPSRAPRSRADRDRRTGRTAPPASSRSRRASCGRPRFRRASVRSAGRWAGELQRRIVACATWPAWPASRRIRGSLQRGRDDSKDE